jgi:hypothetical protein
VAPHWRSKTKCNIAVTFTNSLTTSLSPTVLGIKLLIRCELGSNKQNQGKSKNLETERDGSTVLYTKGKQLEEDTALYGKRWTRRFFLNWAITC